MSCCGEKRAGARASLYAPPAPTPPPRPAPGIRLRYLGSAPILVRGPVSRAAYSFAPGSVVPIDSLDLDALLRTQLFRRDG